MVIGIPNAMYSEDSNLMYKKFFNNLGIKVVFSGVTTNEIKDEGIKVSTSEACLASKIFIGHVMKLINLSKKEKIDYIFIPRICTYKNGETECVRFYAMYDICKNMFDFNFLTLDLDYAKRKNELMSYIELGKKLKQNKLRVIKSYILAKKEVEKNNKATRKFLEKNHNINNKNILVVASPYIYLDDLLGRPICNYLKSQNMNVLYASKYNLYDSYKNITKTLYWKGSKALVSGTNKNLDRCDGIIYLYSFPCGKDNLVTELMKRKITSVPSINLVIDEQTNLEGYITRLESFVDIINNNYIKKAN